MQQQYLSDEHSHKRITLEKQLSEIPALQPHREMWDIEGDWQGAGTILFLNVREQAKFDNWKDFDYRTIKLINHGTPAVRMTFYAKHKYWLKKGADLLPEEEEERITTYLNGLLHKLDVLRDRLASQTPDGSRKIRQEMVDTWQGILAGLDRYEIALSTYRRGYSYLYIN